MLELIKTFIKEDNPIIKSLIASLAIFIVLDKLNERFSHFIESNVCNLLSINEVRVILIILLSIIGFIVTYIFIRRIPSSNGLRKIVVYFDTDEDENSLRLKKSVEKQVLRLINEFGQGDLSVIFLNKNQVKNKPLISRDMEKIIKKSNANLLFTGNIRCGKISGETIMEVDSSFIMRHSLLSFDSRERLQKDISSNIIQLMRINKNNDLDESRVYSNAVVFSIITAIGFSYIIIDDLYTAKKYFDYAQHIISVDQNIKKLFFNNLKRIVVPTYLTIINRFENEYFTRQNIQNKEYFKHKLIEHKELLKTLKDRYGVTKEVDYKLASSEFVLSRDVNYVREILKIDRDFDKLNNVERYDKAFIFIYEGRYKEAYFIYKRLFTKVLVEDVNIDYVYNYIDYILWDEPDKIGYFIPLIMINYYYRDIEIANNLLEEFISKIEDNELELKEVVELIKVLIR